jgi:hypothetical protein
MYLARKGTIREWRAALPLALCFQQLLRGMECFDLDGSNFNRQADFFWVTVRVPVNDSRPNCIGVFMSDFINTMNIMLWAARSLSLRASWGRPGNR